MSMSADQVLAHIAKSLETKTAVVAAPGGQPAPPPGMVGGGGPLPPVGASPGAPIQPLAPTGAMPPEMMGAMPPEMMGAMPPEMMGAMPPEMMGAMPPEDPLVSMQQEITELRDLMQQLIDGQAAIIESLVEGNGEGTPPAPDMSAPPPPAPDMSAPPQGGDDEMLNMIQQGLRS